MSEALKNWGLSCPIVRTIHRSETSIAVRRSGEVASSIGLGDVDLQGYSIL